MADPIARRPDSATTAVDSATVRGIVSDFEAHGGLLDEVALPEPVEPDIPVRRLWAKYAFDAAMSLVLLVVLAPILLIVALLVKASSPGPVLFRQQRVGRHGHRFVMLKFRSMREPTALVAFVPQPGVAPGGVEGEDRRTLVGRVLRKLSLDELPQLINVLRGEMSLVGPRPERPQFVSRFSQEIPGYAERHRVRPGITGWAQVHGCRGATSIRLRIELDRAYIDSWSFWLDLRIIARTVGAAVGMGWMTAPTDESPHLEVVGWPEPEHRRTRADSHGTAQEADHHGERELAGHRVGRGQTIDS